MTDKKNSSRRAVNRNHRKKKSRSRRSSGSGRILSPRGLLSTAFMAVCFGFPGITRAETWPVYNELMACVRLAACTGAVVLAVLAVRSAYNGRKLLVIAGIVFGGCYLLGRLPVHGVLLQFCRGVSFADAVLCVIGGIIPAFVVYLILRIFGGGITNGTVYQTVRWILIAVTGFLFGSFLYRLVSGQKSQTGRRRRKKRERKRRDKRRNRSSQKRGRDDNNEKKNNTEDPGAEKKGTAETAEDSDDSIRDDSIITEDSKSLEEHPQTAREISADPDTDSLSGKVITREDGCAGFIRNRSSGNPVVLFEDGSSSEIRARGDKYYYESRPGVWTLITDRSEE